MKKLSLQWRITLLTSLLIACACIALNALIYTSGVSSLNDLGNFVFGLESPSASTEINSDVLLIDIPQEKLSDFMGQFSVELKDTTALFTYKAWIATFVITIISGIIAYFVSGHSLKPLYEFSNQIKQVQASNLTSYSGLSSDIEEFNLLSESFNAMLLRLSDSFSAQRRFVAHAAHEFKTPLARMQAQLELYEREHPQALLSDDSFKKTHELMKEQVQKLNELLKVLLDISELKSLPKSDEVNLAALIDELYCDLVSLADEKQVTLEVSTESCEVLGNDTLLYRMLFNVIENAIKYNKPGGYVNISLAKNLQDRRAHIVIRDNGVGVSEEELKKLLEPFFRSSNSTAQQVDGFGLGLALVKDIVDLHEGSISIKNNIDAGITVEIAIQYI